MAGHSSSFFFFFLFFFFCLFFFLFFLFFFFRRRITTDSLTTQQVSSSSSTSSSSPSSSSSSTSSSSACTHPWRHDVFLSFRGEDTRYSFTDHLHKNLVQKGINTFIDDELRRGEDISQALLQAIEGSRISLIVFSENYASSKWCLDELVHILKCKRSNQQRKVWPVFYRVDPSDVRHQRGSFGDALAKHESNFKGNRERVTKWRAALTDTANLSGWHLSDGYESKFIDEIIEKISMQLKEYSYLNVAKYPVGIHSRLQDMLDRLDVGGSDIRMVGIWGTGGIGKTTIAKAVYNSIAHMFEGSCFLANVRQESNVHGGLLNLQNLLLSKILGGEKMKVINVDEGITLLHDRLRCKRILLVLDDVNAWDQLNKLAGASDWFGPGSRIIITTRDKHLLILHDVNPIYEAKKLDHYEARELLRSYAFKTKTSLDGNEELSVNSIVTYAHGLPLALEVLGSHLCCRPIHQWQAELDGYRRDPNQDIQQILKISYDELEKRVKEVFLDIACFFEGQNKNDVIQILEGCNRINPTTGIEVLEEKALINVDRYGCIWMHDLLEEMGKKIVHDEVSPNEPGERSRLWYYQDVLQVLTKNTGTSKIEGIIVKLPTTDEICWSPKCFKKMKNLKIFINVNGRFCGKVDYYPEQLRFLDWPEYPLQSLPSNFNMNELVQLNMPYNRITRLWEGFKRLQNLKSMNFRECKFLTEIPDLSGCPNLERMDLSWCKSLESFSEIVEEMKCLTSLRLFWCSAIKELPDLSRCPNLECLHLRGCESLVEVQPSVGFLEKLVHLDISHCSNLVKIPRKVNWRSLHELWIEGCEKLESFPEILGEMKCLTSLRLFSCSAIKELPSSFGYLINLEELSLTGFENLTHVSCSIYQLQNLKRVYLFGCPKLITFPNKVNSVVLSPTEIEGFREFKRELNGFKVTRWTSLSDSDLNDLLESLDCASLEKIHISRSSIVRLSLCKFICLRELHLRGCSSLVEIPPLPPCIKHLDVRNCRKLERISKLSKILEGEESQMIEEMDLSNCRKLIRELVKEAKDCRKLERISKLSKILEGEESQMIDEVDLSNCRRLIRELVKEANVVLNDAAEALFPPFLSCQQSKFTVTCPGSEFPKWFSCQMDFQGLRRFEFVIEILPNCKWENTGLALCVLKPQSGDSEFCNFEVLIYINEVKGLHLQSQYGASQQSDHVWLHYIPFHEMWRVGYMRPLPPFMCRVIIFQSRVGCIYETPLKSCGVHLVMPPNEDICMKLSRAENITNELPEDIHERNDCDCLEKMRDDKWWW